MNPKLQKTIKEIERTKAKIAELQALLPRLEKQRTDLENAEIVKVFRSAHVAPDDFTAFIEQLKGARNSGAAIPAQQNNMTEDLENEE